MSKFVVRRDIKERSLSRAVVAAAAVVFFVLFVVGVVVIVVIVAAVMSVPNAKMTLLKERCKLQNVDALLSSFWFFCSVVVHCCHIAITIGSLLVVC